MDNSEKTETVEVVEEVAQTVAPAQPTTPLSNIFKSTTPKASTVVKEPEPIATYTCTNCEDSGFSCSTCGYNKP